MGTAAASAESQDAENCKEKMAIVLVVWTRNLRLKAFPAEIFKIIKTYALRKDRRLFEESRDAEYFYKVVAVGNTGVGKSALVMNRRSGNFSEVHKPTIGADFETYEASYHKQNILLQVWDMAGAARFQALAFPFYRGAIAFLFCYDMTDRKSLMDIGDYWIDTVRNNADMVDESDVKMILVGAKCDLGYKACSEQDIMEIVEKL